MFNYFEKIHIFRKFLLSYILILVIPLFSNLLIYQVSIHKLKEHATESSRSLLNETSNLIDKHNSELESFTYQMAQNPDVNQLMIRKPLDHNIGYNIYQVINSIRPYWSTNTFFKNFYIYFNDINTIVSPESSYVRPKDYYKTHSYQQLNYNDWNQKFNQTYLSSYYFPPSTVKIGTTTESVITYVQSIPLNTTTNPKANIVVMIDEKEITSLLHQVSSQYDGSAFVYDDKGNIIFSDNINKDMLFFDPLSGKYKFTNEDKKFMVIESKSHNNKWTYVATISKVKLSEDVKHIQTINMLIAMITIIVGLAIAFLFSYRYSIPLNRLLGIMTFPESGKVKNPYDFLHSNVKDIIAKNDDLKSQVQNQLPILQDTVIRKLIHREISSSNEALLLIDQANLSIKGTFGHVGVVRILHILKQIDKEILDEMNVAQLFIQKELTELFQGEILCSHLDVDEVVFLLFHANMPSVLEEERLNALMNSLIRRLEEKYSLKVNVGLGQPFDQLIDIHQSFEEAKLCLPFIQSIDQKSSFHKYLDYVKTANVEYYFPIELELRLINAAANGETNEVKELLHKIYAENVENRLLTQPMGNQILASLNGTILRILSKTTQIKQTLADQIITRLEEIKIKKYDFHKGFEAFQEILIEISMCIDERKTVGGQQVIRRIKDCVKQTFHDPNLTLYKLSESVGISEKMISGIFKEHTDMNISDYIEEIRINFAKSKLTHTECSIEDLAVQSGYNSGHSFRRAFKRNTGISPSEFRKMMLDM